MGFVAEGHYGKQGLCGDNPGRPLSRCELGVGCEEIQGCLLVHAKISSENSHERLISMLNLVVTWKCCVLRAASAMDENHATIGGVLFLKSDASSHSPKGCFILPCE